MVAGVINFSQFLHRHLDNFILTQNLSFIYKIQDFGSGQIRASRQFCLSPGMAKIAPWWLARRDNFLARVPGLVSADSATNVYSLNHRAVRLSKNLSFLFITMRSEIIQKTLCYVS
jgi:hypothetical protein